MPKAYKQQQLHDYFSIFKEEYKFSSVELSQNLNISLPTVLQYIKNNINNFTKVSAGTYVYTPANIDVQPPVQDWFLEDLLKSNKESAIFIAPDNQSATLVAETESTKTEVIQPRYYEW
jgi:hypothetical protein